MVPIPGLGLSIESELIPVVDVFCRISFVVFFQKRVQFSDSERVFVHHPEYDPVTEGKIRFVSFFLVNFLFENVIEPFDIHLVGHAQFLSGLDEITQGRFVFVPSYRGIEGFDEMSHLAYSERHLGNVSLALSRVHFF